LKKSYTQRRHGFQRASGEWKATSGYRWRWWYRVYHPVFQGVRGSFHPQLNPGKVNK
jgi:hypothetical protein